MIPVNMNNVSSFTFLEDNWVKQTRKNIEQNPEWNGNIFSKQQAEELLKDQKDFKYVIWQESEESKDGSTYFVSYTTGNEKVTHKLFMLESDTKQLHYKNGCGGKRETLNELLTFMLSKDSNRFFH